MAIKFCHSEADAKKKACPILPPDIFREPVNDGVSFRIERFPLCIASGCMMWRYVETHIKDANGDLTILSGDTHGYCGLAGAPLTSAQRGNEQ